ncbi:MAG TPA: hypothetical protein VHT51_03395 [Micropepsaceae bacterium]|jgi:hypothetical protein|nr:hypothetical protein [Micropepsaceae bacterium]
MHFGNPRPAAFLFLLALAGASPAAAADIATTRQAFFTADSSAPELAKDYVGSHPGYGIEITEFHDAGKDPTQIFHGLGPVSRSRAGVCRFTATEIFPHRADDGAISWDSMPLNPREHAEPPFTMAAVGGANCPRQDAAAYAALESGISDAEFIAVTNFWKDISKSEGKFDDASVYLSLIVSQKVADAFATFRSALFGSGPPPQLQAIFRGGLEAYDLAFGDSSANTSNFFLSISKSSTGFQVLNFQTQY